MRHGEQHRPETAPKESSQWFDILAFPQTLDGFRLTLISNEPRTIAPRHRRRFAPLVAKALTEKTGTPGFHNTIKVNLHPLTISNNTISYKTTPTQYVEFITLSNRKHVPESLQKQIRSSGVQVVWRTTEPDGSHKFVYEVRSQHTGIYPSFGGTIGGSIDGEMAFPGVLDDRGVLKDGSPSRIIGQAVQEAEEELGIGEVVGARLRESYNTQDGRLVVMGIAKDKKKNYYDALCRGLLPFSQEQLQELYETHKAGGNDKMHDPMPKQLIFMEDRPEVYQRLLSSLMPLTPMTQAPLLLAGYMSRMEEVLSAGGSQEEALRQAVAWKRETEQLMYKKDAEMDKRAKKERKRLKKDAAKRIKQSLGKIALHKDTPLSEHHALQTAYVDWRNARRRPKGLSVELPPQEQGLPKTETTLDELLQN